MEKCDCGQAGEHFFADGEVMCNECFNEWTDEQTPCCPACDLPEDECECGFAGMTPQEYTASKARRDRFAAEEAQDRKETQAKEDE